MTDFLSGTAILVLVIALLCIGPFLTIWTLNTLFPVLAIPFTFWTWLAGIWLNWVTFGARQTKKD